MNFLASAMSFRLMKRWHLFTAFALALGLLAGCATLDEKQRAWIFQPSDRSWGGASMAEACRTSGSSFDSRLTGQPTAPAWPVAGGRAARCAGAAVPARRALERDRLGHAHPAHAGAGLFGAGH
jgi:hypothetical protein